MAPRRGGGGGGISISVGDGDANCPSPFASDNINSVPVAYFVAFCLFFVVAFVTLIAMCKVRKAHPHAKRIIGAVYGIALSLYTLGYALLIIATMLRNCGTTPASTYNDWALVTGIFFGLANFLLLVLVFWAVNSALSKTTGKQTIVNLASAVVLGIMFCLTAGYIGVSSYNDWSVTEEGRQAHAKTIYKPYDGLLVAYWTLYLLSVIGAAVLQIINIASVRARGIQTGNLSAWVAFTMFSMFIWTLFYLIQDGAAMALNYELLLPATQEAFEYVRDFFQASSFIGLLGIAQSTVFANTTMPAAAPQMYNNPSVPQQYAPVPQQYPPQQQYAYDSGNGTQQYYYQQQPVYNNVPAPMNGQGQFVHGK